MFPPNASASRFTASKMIWAMVLSFMISIVACSDRAPSEPAATSDTRALDTPPSLSPATSGLWHNHFMRRAATLTRLHPRKELSTEAQFALLRRVTAQVATELSTDPRAAEWAGASLRAMIERDGPSGNFYAYRGHIGAVSLPSGGPMASGYVSSLSQEAMDLMSSIEGIMSDEFMPTEDALAGVAYIRITANNSTTLSSDDLDIILAMASIAESSRSYWDAEAVATYNGGGEWPDWPLVEEWETAPPQFAPNAVGPI